MARITREISDRISNYLYKKYSGDRVHVMRAHKEIASFMNTYGKHISEVPPNNATSRYCTGDWCFDTVAKAKLFKSVYPDIADILTKKFGAKIEVLLCMSTPGYPREPDEEESDHNRYSKIYTREFDDITYPREPDDTFETWLSRVSKIVFNECVMNEWNQMAHYFSGVSEEELLYKYAVGVCEFEEYEGFKNGIKVISTSEHGEIKTGVVEYPSFKRVEDIRDLPHYEAIL